MSFVPVTGRATFRTADPPRESVVEFTDERRTVSLPIRAALPVLSRAHARDDVHPSVGLLAGAVLLGPAAGGGGQDRARRVRAELADGAARRRRRRSGADAGRRSRRRAGRGRRRRAGRARGARRGRRRHAPQRPGRPRRASTYAPGPPRGRASRPDSSSAWPSGWRRRATTGPSWCGSRCGSRPTRRSWSPAPCGWCSRCTTSRTPSTSARRPSCGPSRAPRPATASVTGRGPTRRIALRAAADAWPVLDRLLELRVPDQITLDSDELVSLLEYGVGALRERGVDVLWPRSLGRDLTATTVLDRTPGTREEPADQGDARHRLAVPVQLADRPPRRAADRGGDGPAGRRRGADPQAARQLDGHRPVDRPQGPQATGPHRQARPGGGRGADRGGAGRRRGRRPRGGRPGRRRRLAAAGARPAPRRPPTASRSRRRRGCGRRCATTSGTASPGSPS